MAFDSREETLRALEAILFASGYPVKFDVIADVLGTDGETARELARELSDSYEGRGIELCVLEDACQLCSRAEYEEAVRAALGIRRGSKLSPALMEVLSIVAYRQPVTKAYIEQVRGVDCTYSITALLDRSMIENVGHLDLPGRPALYGTTPDFLRVFGITTLDELPPIELFDSVGGQGTDLRAAEVEDSASNAAAVEDSASNADGAESSPSDTAGAENSASGADGDNAAPADPAGDEDPENGQGGEGGAAVNAAATDTAN